MFCGWESEKVDPTRTLKDLLCKKKIENKIRKASSYAKAMEVHHNPILQDVFLLCRISLRALALAIRYAFRLPLVGSRLNLLRAPLRSLVASLQMSEKRGLLKRFGTVVVLGIVFFCNVLQVLHRFWN